MTSMHTSAGTAPDPSRDSQRVMDALRRLVRALSTSARERATPQGISGAQRFVLRQLVAAGELSVGELASRTFSRQSTVSEVVARLVERGFATREPGLTDARQSRIVPTARGRRAVAGMEPSAQERRVAGLESLPATRRDTLAAALEEWIVASGLAETPPTMFFEEPAP